MKLGSQKAVIILDDRKDIFVIKKKRSDFVTI